MDSGIPECRDLGIQGLRGLRFQVFRDIVFFFFLFMCFCGGGGECLD